MRTRVAAARAPSPAHHADQHRLRNRAPIRATTGTAASAARRRSRCFSTRSPARRQSALRAAPLPAAGRRHDAGDRAAQPPLLVEDGGRWEFFWISMSGQEAVRIHRAIQATTGPVLRLRRRRSSISPYCCLRLIEGEGETPGAASAIAYEAATALYDDVFGSQARGRRTRVTCGHDRVVDHVLANLDKAADRRRPRRDRRLQPRAFLARSSRRARAYRRPSSCCRSGCAARRGFLPGMRSCRSRRSQS